MKTRRQAVLRLAAMASSVGGALATACGGTAAQPSSAPQKPWPAEMTWLGWSAGSQWLVPTYEEVANGFAEQHAGTKLTSIAPGGDYREKFTTLISAGTPPDVADVHHQRHVRDVGPTGLVQDLTPLLKRDGYPKDYVGWEPYAWLNHQYGVPWAIQSTAIFFNKSLFDMAGVQYPSAEWTWSDFVAAARRLTKPGADANSTIWGAADQGGQNQGWVDALLHAYGSSIFSPDYSATTLANPHGLEAIDFRAGWGSKLKIAPNQPNGSSGQFTKGTVAMALSGSWFVANVKQNSQSALMTSQVPWDVAPVPRGPARRAGLTHELGVGLPAGVQNLDASWAALRYLTSGPGLTPFAKIGRTIPPQRSLWQTAVPTDGTPAGFKRAFIDGWEQLSVPSPFVPKWADVEPIWKEELDKVWTGERPVRDGTAAFVQRMDDFLKQLKGEGLL
jgi:multiple sugar transport system substrate-binding protein